MTDQPVAGWGKFSRATKRQVQTMSVLQLTQPLKYVHNDQSAQDSRRQEAKS